MSFRWRGYEFNIRLSFFATVAALTMLGYGRLVLLMYALISVHELTHIFTAGIFGARCERVTIFPFGQCADINGLDDISILQRICVILSGPLFNLGLGLLLWGSRVGWLNMGLFAFNLLPVYPLDGGRLVQVIAAYYAGTLRTGIVLSRVSYIISCIIAAVGVLQLIYGGNFSALLVGGFLLRVNRREYINCAYSFYKTLINKRMNRAMPVRELAFSPQTSLKSVMYRLGVDYYSVVVVVADDGIKARLDENVIKQYIINNGMQNKLVDIMVQFDYNSGNISYGG